MSTHARDMTCALSYLVVFRGDTKWRQTLWIYLLARKSCIYGLCEMLTVPLTASNDDQWIIENLKGGNDRRLFWSKITAYACRNKKATRNLCEYILFPGHIWTRPGPTEYDAGALTTWPRRSVKYCVNSDKFCKRPNNNTWRSIITLYNHIVTHM